MPARKMKPHDFSDVIRVRKSAIHGRGIFTTVALPARRKLGEITGRLVKLPQARKDIEWRQRIYFVELSDQLALDCSKGNCFSRINHSCNPNCYLRIIGNKVEVYTLKPIKKGSELIADYGETPHKNGMSCRCGQPDCRRKL